MSRISTPSEPAEFGVLTAADNAFFEGVRLLYYSGGSTAPMAVVDLGLRPDQRDCCSARMLVLEPQVVMPRTVELWQTWNKPFFIANSPFSKTLWLDADCLVVGDLGPLFEHISRQPLVIRHWCGAK